MPRMVSRERTPPPDVVDTPQSEREYYDDIEKWIDDHTPDPDEYR